MMPPVWRHQRRGDGVVPPPHRLHAPLAQLLYILPPSCCEEEDATRAVAGGHDHGLQHPGDLGSFPRAPHAELGSGDLFDMESIYQWLIMHVVKQQKASQWDRFCALIRPSLFVYTMLLLVTFS